MAKRTIALLSNVTSELIAMKLRDKYDVYIPEGYDTWIQDALNADSALYSAKADCIFLLLDGTAMRNAQSPAEIGEQLSVWMQAIRTLADNFATIPLFVPTIDVRQCRVLTASESIYRYQIENKWYQFVDRLCQERENVYTFDIKDRVTDLGRERFYSDKMWYMSGMPYSKEGIACICTEIRRLAACAFEPRKKAIVLDLDNTLWGGVIGEDGLEGIALSNHKEGERFYAFQRALLEMKKRGVILAIDSKNDLDDVKQALSRHPHMLLREDDFVAIEANWRDKAANLKDIAERLNLTEASFVFIDDNPMEREIVGSLCPEVTVPDFPRDTTRLLPFAEDLYDIYFKSLRLTEEDKRKTEQYKNESDRRRELAESLSLEEYVSRLEICVDIHKLRGDELLRAAQLCGKTNQFNLTTKRYTAEEIDAMANDEACSVFAVHTRDKYDDNGFVSLLILKRRGDEMHIDTFLMSCRVMGRQIEDSIINEIACFAREKGCKRLIGEYIWTGKNTPVRALYPRLGFTLSEERDGLACYVLGLSGYERKRMDHFKQVVFSEE